MPLRIGYKASAEQFGPAELVDLAVGAEEHGFDSVWVSDHFQPWRHEGGHAPSSLAFLGAAGARTSRVVLGTSVLTPTFRYNPAVVAQVFATLGSLFPARVVLGVGTGEAMNETAVTGAEWPSYGQRLARLGEAIDLIRRLWTGERTSFEGEHFRTVDATLYDVPAEPVPIYVAAGGPKSAEFAGRVGDGIICTSGKGMALYTDDLLPGAQRGLESSRDPARPFGRTIEVKLSYDRDQERALENTRFWAPLSLTAEQKSGLTDPMDIEKAADELPIEQVARRWIVSSDPEEAVEAVRPYVEAGLDHLVVHAPGEDQRRFFDEFAADVLPRLRALEPPA